MRRGVNEIVSGSGRQPPHNPELNEAAVGKRPLEQRLSRTKAPSTNLQPLISNLQFSNLPLHGAITGCGLSRGLVKKPSGKGIFLPPLPVPTWP